MNGNRGTSVTNWNALEDKLSKGGLIEHTDASCTASFDERRSTRRGIYNHWHIALANDSYDTIKEFVLGSICGVIQSFRRKGLSTATRPRDCLHTQSGTLTQGEDDLVKTFPIAPTTEPAAWTCLYVENVGLCLTRALHCVV
jgi:hypothetical protein